MDFSEITPEMREKARACESPADLIELAKSEGYELSTEELAAVSGGMTWGCSEFFAWDCDDYVDDCLNDYYPH